MKLIKHINIINLIRDLNLINPIRKAGTLAGVFAAVAMLFSCSSNVEDGLYAASESNLALTVSAEGLSNGLIEIGSTPTSTTFDVTSTTRWTVDVTDCDGAWCQIVYGSGQSQQLGDGSFTVEASSNRSDKERECNITVYAIESDGSHIPGRSVLIHFSQNRQSIAVNYAGDVISPYGTQDNEPTITVTANQAWAVSTSHPWVEIVPGAGMDGDGYTPADGSDEEKSISFRIRVEPNPGRSARNAEITISSPTSAFTPRRLTVTQNGSTDIFFVAPTTPPAVGDKGGEMEFMVYSPRDNWEVTAISAGDWITLDRSSGNASTEAGVVKVTIKPNYSSESREGRVVFRRSSNDSETTVRITQNGVTGTAVVPDPSPYPQVSTAWIVSGWTQNSAQLRAYYVTPGVTVTGCGAFLHPVNDDSEQATRTYKGTLGENNMLIVDLTDLEPNTEYKAWGFVEYRLDGSDMGSAGNSTIFRTLEKSTSGQPGSDDNNPPTID